MVGVDNITLSCNVVAAKCLKGVWKCKQGCCDIRQFIVDVDVEQDWQDIEELS